MKFERYNKLKLGYFISNCFKKGLNSIIIKDDFIIVELDKEVLKIFLCFLKNHVNIRCNTLLDIWGVDYPDLKNRFEVNYLLLSVKYRLRVVVKVRVDESEGISSVVSLFKSAGWLEREVWDMYGVYFLEHFDLRRILTDYGFEGYPLRKDFPLSGYVEVRYDDGEKRIVVEALEMMQDFRYFNFASPWEKERKN